MAHPRLSERDGCLALKREFEAAGLSIQDGFPLELGEGLRLDLDGFDGTWKIGYEFVTAEAGDRKAVSPAVIEALERAMAAGTLHVLLVDEWEVESEEELARFARQFLAELKTRGALP